MTTRRVDFSDLGQALVDFGSATLKQQQAIVANSLAKAIPKLVEASPVDTGLYAQSWDFTMDEKGAIIGNFAPYAAVIEYGARPFTPPIAPLLAWAKRVLQDPSQPPNYSSEVWALAKGVQNKIAAHGMKPQHILENMIPVIIADIKRELEKLG